jgi:hypothetical protein
MGARLSLGWCGLLTACIGTLDGQVTSAPVDAPPADAVTPATERVVCERLTCDDGNPCTDDGCAPQVGCWFDPHLRACDDGDRCTAGEHCRAGICQGGHPGACDAEADPCQGVPPESWIVETVDAYGDSGEYASLAIDAGGTTYIGYHSESRGALMLAHRPPGGAWVLEVVAPEVGYAPFSTLVLDQGAPGLVYSSAFHYELRCATLGAEGTWVLETLAETSSPWTQPAAAVDTLGTLHVLDAPAFHRVRHLTRSAGGAVTETEIGDDTWIWDGNLAADGQGGVHTAFVESLILSPTSWLARVWYGRTSAATGWVQELAFELPFAGTFVPTRRAVAVDEGGAPHLLHLEFGGNVLRHLRRGPTGTWEAAVVDGQGVGQAFAAAHRGGVFMAAYDHLDAQELRFAWRRNDGTYATEVADAHPGFTDGSAFDAVSLSVDLDGRPRVAYRETHQRDLRLASRCAAVAP